MSLLGEASVINLAWAAAAVVIVIVLVCGLLCGLAPGFKYAGHASPGCIAACAVKAFRCCGFHAEATDAGAVMAVADASENLIRQAGRLEVEATRLRLEAARLAGRPGPGDAGMGPDQGIPSAIHRA